MGQILNHVEEAPQPPPNKPKLTMKFLHVLINEILLVNESLEQRVNVLEQQLSEINVSRSEVAASNTTTKVQSQIREEIRVSRVDRHTPNRRKRLWF